MHKRVNPYQIAPALGQQAARLQSAIDELGLDKTLGELVKIRASQINRCAFCLHMHTRDARALGEREVRIHLLPAFRESSLYTPRERAALAYVEALSEVSQKGAPDALYEQLTAHFSEREIVALTGAIAMINFWNRLAIGFAIAHPEEPAQGTER